MTLFHNLLHRISEWFEGKISQITQTNLLPETGYDGGIEDELWICSSEYLSDELKDY